MEELFTRTVVSTADEPCAIAIDPGSNQLYWVAVNEDGIRKSDINGENTTTIMSLEFPTSLDLDLINRLVFSIFIAFAIPLAIITGCESVFIMKTKCIIGFRLS